LSLFVLTQTLPASVAHTVWPGAHCVAQLPETHVAPAGHVFPHPPQFAGSTLVWTQLWPHWLVPPPQLVAQVPCEQTSPAAHAFPHLPQFAGSSEVVAQTEPQRVWLDGHATAPSVLESGEVELSCADPLPPPQPCTMGAIPNETPINNETANGHE